MATSAGKDAKENAAAAPAADFKWIPLARDYGLEHDRCVLPRTHADTHPLMPRDKMPSHRSTPSTAAAAPATPTPLSSPLPKKNTRMDDPLSMMAAASKSPSSSDIVDPLRAMKASADSDSSGAMSSASALSPGAVKSISTIESVSYGAVQSSADSSAASSKAGAAAGEYEPWREKRAGILTKYTTNKKIPVQANFLEEEAVSEPKAVDTAKSRLEELEEAVQAEASGSKISMSQKEYITHIEEQHERLKNAWEAGERVLSLKIAIQCAKLLGDSSVPQFYPSMYVLLTDILDTFGDLVFERIKARGVDVINSQTNAKSAASLPANFKHTDVSASAQETCRNWLFKTACVRELIPRLYIDMCLLKTYRFIDSDDAYPTRIARLSRMVRGIGDPLCATYARAYLCTKAGDVWNCFTNDTAKAGAATTIPKIYQAVLVEGFDDFLFTYKSLLAGDCADIRTVRDGRITKDEYIDLYSPALQWMLQNIGYRASEDLFFALLQQYKDYCNCSSVLVHILSSFDPSFVSNHALDMTAIIKSSDEISACPKSKLYLTLGRALVQHAPPPNQRLPILNDVWKVVTKIADPSSYIEIASVFVHYLLLNFSDREVNIFLKDVLKHMRTEDAPYKSEQAVLAAIVQKIMLHSKDLSKTLSMDHFLPILDLLEQDYRVQASKAVLIRFSQSGFNTSDPVIIHTLFDVARACHDSIDSMSFEDDRKQISLLIINFIRRIDFARDLEQQLAIYVECRQAFTRLDLVTQELVLRVALLCMKAHRFVKGNHSKKTAAFVKACLAYAHITIPSLEDIFAKLRLLLICGEVALVNAMVVQAEAFLKAAISLIPDVPPTLEVYKQIVPTEDELVGILRNFTSFLLLFPGHPEHGPFYLVKGLLNAVQTYAAWSEGSVGKTRVFLAVFSLFCTYYQRSFPYHIARVESNDDLFGSDPAYVRQLLPFLDTLLSEILAQLTQIGEKGDLLSKKQQGTLALDLVNLLVSSLEMNAASATLVVKLIGLAHKTDAVDANYLRATVRHITDKRATWYQEIATKLQQQGIATQ